MKDIVWLFPIIFMIHEMEEIIGFRIWLNRNVALVKKYPLLVKIDKSFSYEGFSVAVLEQYLLCILITLLSIYYDNYLIWIGFFIAFVIHLAIHILQSIVIRKYIPALITSITLLPISAMVLNRSINQTDYSNFQIVIVSVCCFIVMILNLIFMHYVMKQITQKYVFKNTLRSKI